MFAYRSARILFVALLVLSLSLVTSLAAVAAEGGEALPQPKSLIVDASLQKGQVEATILAARRYYAFWDTGEARYAQAALSPNFVDRMLPKGRPQGPLGPILASQNFRAAVPDLRVEVEETIVTGDRVVGRLRFTGHFTGTFGERKGDGRAVDFRAVDIYRVQNGRITDNWHVEDNLTFLQQLGVVAQS
jgi:predicted ester cyclase